LKYVGFTGTRKGLTEPQRDALFTIILDEDPSLVFHGDCIGADKEFNDICKALGVRRLCLPCNLSGQRAYSDAELYQPPKAPLARNHDIVRLSHVMIACPGESSEVLRSGTWATIRYARTAGKRLIIILPDGKLVRQND